MAEILNLNKQVYNKAQFEKVIDTSFSQLVNVSASLTSSLPPITVDQFFQYYQNLFFQIPKSGSINSFEYIIQTANDYLGTTTQDADFSAFINEINSLRQENLDLQQQLISISTKSL
jgi:hypothetical protein